MRRDFHESYAEEAVAPPSERATGLVFAAVAAIAGAVFYANVLVLAVCAGLCLGLIAVSAFRPALLRPVNRAWFRFSLLLSRIVNPVVLGLMYALAILPFGLVMRLWRDPLRRRRTDAPSYWIERDRDASGRGSMADQF